MINPGLCLSLIFPHISQYFLIFVSEMLNKANNRMQISIGL